MNPSAIPRLIHQTWKDGRLPVAFARHGETWKRHHPTWEYRFHDDDACRLLVQREFPDLLALYDALPRPIMRVDLFRYLVVSRHGGLYVDMDMECLKPVDPLLAEGSCVLATEAHVTRAYQRLLGYEVPRQIANCVFAAAPGHPFLTRIVDRIRELAGSPVTADAGVEDITGPRMLTRVYESLPDPAGMGIVVLPQVNLLPPLEYPDLFPFNRKMYARHHCAGTWKRDGVSKSFRQRLLERNRWPRFW